jgi:hypothetical protein
MKTNISSEALTKAQTSQRDTPRLDIGCTAMRHAQIGINAVVNARGGLQSLNDRSLDEIEMIRDGRKVRNYQLNRVRFYQFNSRFFRKHQNRLSHLLSRYDD